MILPAGAPSFAGSPPCSGAWIIEPAPNPTDGGSWLADVTAISPTDAWAVGGVQGDTELVPLAIHWDGVGWSQVPAPSFRVGNADLRSVTAVSSNDVWAVGGTYGRVLILHWNGTQWNKTPTPEVRANEYIADVHAVDHGDVWAVGQKYWRGVVRPHSLRWTGQQWTKVDVSRAPEGSTLDAVDGSAPNDVWAVGATAGNPFAMYWNGSAFRPVRMPPLGVEQESMTGVAAPALGEVLAIGAERYETGKYGEFGIGAHRTAGSWAPVEMANPSTPGFEQQLNAYYDISAVSTFEAWAAGYHGAYNYLGHGRTLRETLIAHWNGSEWSAIESPNIEGVENELAGIDVLSSGDVWAVGNSHQMYGETRAPLVLHHC